MPLDLWLCISGLAISLAMAAAIFASAHKPGGRQPFLAFVFIEAAAFFAASIASRLGGAFAAAAFSYCGSLFGLPSLYLFERSTLEKVDRRALKHYLPALVNFPIALYMAASGSGGRGGLGLALYYLALVIAQSLQLILYGRAALALARGYGKGQGSNWLLRAARAVIAAYAVITALGWAIILATVAEEILGREIEIASWVDPAAALTASFLAWTLGLCLLWGSERGSEEGRDRRKYGGRSFSAEESALLVRRVRELLEKAGDLASEEIEPRSLAARLGVPYYLLSRAVNELEGMSLLELVNGYRVERAKAVLAGRPEASVLDACFEAGFQSKSTFNEVFRRKVGMTPRVYRLEAGAGSPAKRARS